ncbi:MAG: LON peptidase substrate-binding domain-containing protein [Gammaproteobacteria bacterium]|nr:LON peptidase substrate-binding domain-containing protein [Pseudomonadales bacterium]MCP5349142.1 LON peptidase substrate-binding domain-containing protein [Pseudomonadales bacterium]
MSELQEIPLFPLRSVLFPGGKLSLQIFEKRYIDLVTDCLRNDVGFGITLLKEGEEVLKPGRTQQLHPVGTLARIIDWDQLDNGLLGIIVQGDRKFEIDRYWQRDSGLFVGAVSFPENGATRQKKIQVGEEMAGLTELLQVLEKHPVVQEMNLEIDYDNLWDLGWRLSELIPVALEIKQELLELDDPWERIRLVEQSIHFLIGD